MTFLLICSVQAPFQTHVILLVASSNLICSNASLASYTVNSRALVYFSKISLILGSGYHALLQPCILDIDLAFCAEYIASTSVQVKCKPPNQVTWQILHTCLPYTDCAFFLQQRVYSCPTHYHTTVCEICTVFVKYLFICTSPV